MIRHFKVVLWVSGTTGKDFGFVTNHGLEEGLGCQVTQFVSYLIVAQDYKTTFLVTQGMQDTKLLPATITM